MRINFHHACAYLSPLRDLCLYIKQIKEQTGLQVLPDGIYIAAYYVLQAQKINPISFVLFDIMDVYCGAGRDQQAEQ